MEDKFELQFEDGEYCLVRGDTNDVVATTDKVLLKEYPGYMQKLSTKNCEAIKNGYDLDELALSYVSDHLTKGTDEYHNSQVDFKEGFQKALELMGDKKYSEDDVVKIAEYVRVASQSSPSVRTKYLLAEYQSQEQTEWNVEIETIDYGLGNDENGRPVFETKNLLDADGCLILKRK